MHSTRRLLLLSLLSIMPHLQAVDAGLATPRLLRLKPGLDWPHTTTLPPPSYRTKRLPVSTGSPHEHPPSLLISPPHKSPNALTQSLYELRSHVDLRLDTASLLEEQPADGRLQVTSARLRVGDISFLLRESEDEQNFNIQFKKSF